MKRTHVFLLTALLLLSGTTQALTPSATSIAKLSSRVREGSTYAQGVQDGNARAADLAATYGYGTTDYQNAIDAEVADADYQALHSENPLYWRGYSHALRYY